MATNPGFVEFICDQINECGNIRNKKMFGEYMVYVNEKPVLLICNDIVYVKIKEEIEDLMRDAETGFPYNGAKEHYILDIEAKELSVEVVNILEKITPLPKPKKKKQ